MAEPDNPNSADPDLNKSASDATATRHYDLPEDEDLSPLDQAQAKETKLNLNWKLSGLLAICLLIGAAVAQHIAHGPLFLNPKAEQVVLLYRTQVGNLFGMSPIRLSTTPTFRYPFLELARLVRNADLATTVEIEGINAEKLTFPNQRISVLWSLDPIRLLDDKHQGLVAANGTEALVKQLTILHASDAMRSSSIAHGNLGMDASHLRFENSLRRSLYDHGIRLESVQGMHFQIKDELRTVYLELAKEKEQLVKLEAERKRLITVRQETLSQIKSESEASMAKMVGDHGVAMAQLQDAIDKKSQQTASTITESRLAAEADRTIFQLRAQHLRELYEHKAARYEEFFKTNQNIHPLLPKVAPQSLRPSATLRRSTNSNEVREKP